MFKRVFRMLCSSALLYIKKRLTYYYVYNTRTMVLLAYIHTEKAYWTGKPLTQTQRSYFNWINNTRNIGVNVVFLFMPTKKRHTLTRKTLHKFVIKPRQGHFVPVWGWAFWPGGILSGGHFDRGAFCPRGILSVSRFETYLLLMFVLMFVLSHHLFSYSRNHSTLIKNSRRVGRSEAGAPAGGRTRRTDLEVCLSSCLT